MLRKALYDAQCSHCLVSDSLPHSPCKHRSTHRCPITAKVTPQNSAPQLWKMPKNSHDQETEIKLWCTLTLRIHWVYHQPTCTQGRTGTFHQQTTRTCHNTATVSTCQTHGRTPTHSNAEIHWHLMCNTVTNEPHHIFASRHPHIWWTGHHKAERLAQWHWDGSWHLEVELSMPDWGQIMQLNPHSHS